MTVGQGNRDCSTICFPSSATRLEIDVKQGNACLLDENRTELWSSSSVELMNLVFFDYWHSDTHLLVCDDYSAPVLRINLASGELSIACQLNRKEVDNSGLFHNRFDGIDMGCLLSYEAGAIRFDQSGNPQWDWPHPTIDFFLESIDATEAWYESSTEGRVGVNLLTGTLIEGIWD